MKKPLAVVRINHEYDARLLEELATEAIKPFNGVFEFDGVEPAVAKVTFEPPPGENGLYGWVANAIRQRFVISNPNRYVLLVMPHPMMNEGGEPNPGLGGQNVALISTAEDYMNPADRRRFLHYAGRVAAHEFGHMFPFELEHHERPVRTAAGKDCLMYVGRGVGDKVALDKMGMTFCGNCDYQIKARGRTFGLLGTFEAKTRNAGRYRI
ncbi:MAG: hypothetical protein HY516_05140 [Candidatus Aenigmarchaeota archaeon]|nr:hypothetical protein [Candidatus Aenigmarchaeota archaeon]